MFRRQLSVVAAICFYVGIVLSVPISIAQAQASASSAGGPADDVRSGFVVVDSISKLRSAMDGSHGKIRMKPGTYRITDTAGDGTTVFYVSGDDNYFDLRGVTLEIETSVLAGMHGKVHSLTAYRVLGNHLIFEGGRFEDIGDRAPSVDLSEFVVTGDDVTFRECSFFIRGSSPYGYGDMYGKGKDHAVQLHKHAAMEVAGDRTLISDCNFHIHAFGHGIHVHGAQDTVIRNVTVEGEVRPTEEIYKESTGLAAHFGYKMMYPPWANGKPIPHNQMLSLTEDGIRAYLDGPDRHGRRRRTGLITVENCVVNRMRGGITLALAAKAKVSGCTVTDCGGHAYSFPSDCLVRDCQGNAAFSPLLIMPYSNRRNADIELRLLPSTVELGEHSLAEITGTGHRIRITNAEQHSGGAARVIVVGSTGDRYTEDDADVQELAAKNKAVGIVLENLTDCPVVLAGESSVCHVTSRGKVEDHGSGNIITQAGLPGF